MQCVQFNKTWINSYKAWAVQRLKNVDVEKYSPLEVNHFVNFVENFEELMERDHS